MVFAGLHGSDCLRCYRIGLHLRGLVKRHPVGFNLHPFFGFLVKSGGVVAVPEISYVAEFLSFTYGILRDTVFCQILRQCAVYSRRSDEIFRGHFCIPIILDHSGIYDIGAVAAFKPLEIVFNKRAADLNRPVTPEVEQDDSISVPYLSKGLIRVVGIVDYPV